MSSIPSDRLTPIDPLELSRPQPVGATDQRDEFVEHLNRSEVTPQATKSAVDEEPDPGASVRDEEESDAAVDEAAAVTQSEQKPAPEKEQGPEQKQAPEREIQSDEPTPAVLEPTDTAVEPSAEAVPATERAADNTLRAQPGRTQVIESENPLASHELPDGQIQLPAETADEEAATKVDTEEPGRAEQASAEEELSKTDKTGHPTPGGKGQHLRHPRQAPNDHPSASATTSPTVEGESPAVETSHLTTTTQLDTGGEAALGRGDTAPSVSSELTAVTDKPSSNRTAPVEGGSPSSDTAPRADQARLIQRVSRAIEVAQQRGGGPIRLRLSPPELGSLRLELQLDQSTLTARIETETNAARHAILENLSILRDRLAEQGIRIEQFDVSWQDPSNGSPQQSERHAPDPRGRRTPQGDSSEAAEEHTKTETVVNSKQINIIV